MVCGPEVLPPDQRHDSQNSVTSIGQGAFEQCYGLTSVTIPSSVTNITDFAFSYCGSLSGIYFKGNAPSLGMQVFYASGPGYYPKVYYLPGSKGWGTFNSKSGLPPAVLWNPQAQNDASFGVQTNQFGFTIAGSSNLVIVVEACTDLVNPVWSPVSTNTLNTYVGTNGTAYFSDPQWTNYSGRFYRFRSP